MFVVQNCVPVETAVFHGGNKASENIAERLSSSAATLTMNLKLQITKMPIFDGIVDKFQNLYHELLVTVPMLCY